MNEFHKRNAQIPKQASKSGHFGREWLRAPLQVGALAPSSTGLSQAITEGLAEEHGPVLELGPGTGVITGAILDRGVPQQQLSIIEASEGFAAALTDRYRGVNVIHGDAARVRHLSPFGPAGAGSIICGLPLVSMTPGKILRVLAGSFSSLRSGGEFRLFTYAPYCPVPDAIRTRLGLVARRAAFVTLNMPPATVYILERKAAP